MYFYIYIEFTLKILQLNSCSFTGENQRFKNGTFKTVTSLSSIQCSGLCYNENDCVSFNYNGEFFRLFTEPKYNSIYRIDNKLLSFFSQIKSFIVF